MERRKCNLTSSETCRTIEQFLSGILLSPTVFKTSAIFHKKIMFVEFQFITKLQILFNQTAPLSFNGIYSMPDAHFVYTARCHSLEQTIMRKGLYLHNLLRHNFTIFFSIRTRSHTLN